MEAEALARVCADAMWADYAATRGLGVELISVEPGRMLAMTVTSAMVNGHNLCRGGLSSRLPTRLRICLQHL
jgi:acyl-CoA thioesterase